MNATRMKIFVSLLAMSACLSAAALDQVATGPIIQGNDMLDACVVDSAGNRYVGGAFSSTLDFNPQVGADDKIGFMQDVFVTRFNADGTYAWTQVVAGSGTQTFGSMALNAAGTVLYVFGSSDSSDLGIGASGSVSANSQDAFIAALQTATGAADTSFSGDGLQLFGGSGLEEAESIVISGSTLYIAGKFASTDASLGGTGSFSAGTGSDFFVLALDTSGALVTAFNTSGLMQIGSPTTNVGFEIRLALAGGTLYAGFTLPAGSDFGVGGSGTLAGVGPNQSFVLALNAVSGASIGGFGSGGIESFGGAGDDSLKCLQAAGGFVYAAGYFNSTDAGFNGSGAITHLGASYSAYIFCLDGSTGAPNTSFSGDGVQIFGGSTGSCAPDDLLIYNSILYATGDFDFTNAGIGALGTVNANGADGWVIALNAATGAAATTFSGDGILLIGGSSSDSGSALAAFGTSIFAGGNSISTNLQVDATGAAYDASGFTSYLVTLAAATTGASAPITAMPNPSRSGTVVTFSSTAAGALIWDFGDGSPTATGNPVSHTFTVAADATYTVTVSGAASGSFTQSVLAANANAVGVPNITNGTTVSNPLTTLSISTTSSDGGVVELTINADAVPRASLDITTDFDDIPGRQSRVTGTRAVHKYTQPGVYVAVSRALDGSGVEKGKMRKTIAISARETGVSGALPAPPSAAIDGFQLKGKFLFTRDTPDLVAFKGEIALPAGFFPKRPDGNVLSLGIGNIVDTVTVDDRGRGGESAKGLLQRVKVRYPRLPKGATLTTGGEIAKIQAQIKFADLDTAGFDTEGVTASLRADEAGAKSVKRTIQMALVIGGASYEAQAQVDYKLSKKADSGRIAGRASAR